MSEEIFALLLLLEAATCREVLAALPQVCSRPWLASRPPVTLQCINFTTPTPLLSLRSSLQLIGSSDAEADALLACARELMAADRCLLVPCIGALSEASLPRR